MTEYVVRFGTPEGAVLEQRHRSMSAEALRRELEGRGLHVFQVRQAGGSLRVPLLRRREKLRSQDFLVFNQQLATLLRAGIPVLQSLELLHRSQGNPFFKQVLARVLDDVRNGVALSDAFAAQGDLFPRLYSATLMAGERSGEIVAVLDRYVKHQQLLEDAWRRVKGALTYPLVLLTLACGLIGLLIGYVIPRFAVFYSAFSADLPLITKVVVTISTWVQGHLPYIGGFLLVAVVVAPRWLRTERGKLFRDRAILRVPFVGIIFKLFALSQFVRSLATLLSGGTPLVSALEVATSTVTNRAISTPLSRVTPRVREGQALWSSLELTGFFPELTLAMVQVGEATGALEEMLFNVARFYDESIEVKLARVVTLIEPFVLIVMGGIVAFLVLSIYLPMFTLMQHAQ